MEKFWDIYKAYIVERGIYNNVIVAQKRLLDFLGKIKIDASIDVKQVAIENHYEYAVIHIEINDEDYSFSGNLVVVIEQDMKSDYVLENLILQLEQGLISNRKESIYYRWLEESVIDLTKEYENGA